MGQARGSLHGTNADEIQMRHLDDIGFSLDGI